MSYAELHTVSAFSFLRGGSFPEHLASTAAGLGMPAVALLDRDGVYGAQRFSVAARENGIRPIIGCELTMEDGVILPVLVESRVGYSNLCQLLTDAHLRSEKGKCRVRWEELPRYAEGWWRCLDWGAQAACLQFAAACRKHLKILPRVVIDPSGKLPDGAGWQPAFPKSARIARSF